MSLAETAPVRDKYITPDRLRQLLPEGDISYVEFEEVAHLDFRLIQAIDLQRTPNLPVAVNIRRVKSSDGLFSNIGVDHFFRSLNNVSFVVVSPEGDDFTLRNHEEALTSKVHFLSRDIGEVTKRRMRKRTSPYTSMLADTFLEQEKFIPPQDLAANISRYQQAGKRIAIACGTFDVLHPGHIAFLEEASTLGNVFFVFTNSDYSMRLQSKSINGDRPIHPLAERIAVLSSLSFVNHVTAFDEPNAEVLFEKLKYVTYVKTEKDRDRPEVQREKAIVLKNGGQYVELPPLSDMARGVVLSSSDVISQIRDGEDEMEEDLLLETRSVTSETVEMRKKEISEMIKRWNKETGVVSALARRLRRRFEESITQASEIEQGMLANVIDISSQIAQQWGNDRSYFGFIIPELLGAMIGLDIRTISVQENTKDSKVVLKNLLKRSDGKATFFHVPSNTISEAIAFEEEFWRSSPYNVNYLPYNRQSALQKRVYLYPEPKHTLGMTLRILMEEYAHTTDPDLREELGAEVTSLSKTAFILFEGRFFEELEEADNEGEWNSEDSAFSPLLPKIIGHGGSSVMKTSGGAIGFAENTQAGILNAFESGVDVIELDVVPCQDGWVISHDIRLSVSTNIDGLTTDRTEDEIRKTRIRLATGEVSDEHLLTLSDALALATKYSEGHEGYLLKLDVKFSDPKLEEKFVNVIKNCGIPLDKILITSGFASITQRIAALCPQLPFELNTVEPTIFLTQYELMDEELMPRVFLSYVQTCAQAINARIVSMMHFGMQKWGDVVTSRLLLGIARMGLDSQVWVVSSVRDYQKYAALGASYALMHDPRLIEIAVMKSRQSRL